MWKCGKHSRLKVESKKLFSGWHCTTCSLLNPPNFMQKEVVLFCCKFTMDEHDAKWGTSKTNANLRRCLKFGSGSLIFRTIIFLSIIDYLLEHTWKGFVLKKLKFKDRRARCKSVQLTVKESFEQCKCKAFVWLIRKLVRNYIKLY